MVEFAENFTTFDSQQETMEARTFYNQQVEILNKEISALKVKLRTISAIRMAVFLGGSFCLYLFFHNTPLIGVTLAVGIVLFLILVNRYANTKRVLNFKKELLRINELEIGYMNGDFLPEETGDDYIYETHDYNQDIDLFGEGSLFQKLNRTGLKNGEKVLADTLNSNTIDDVKVRQKAVQELSEMPEWRQEYTAIAALIKSETSTESITSWIKNHQRFVPKVFSWITIPFSVISVALLTGYFLGYLNGYLVGGWFLLGVAITSKFLKRITQMYNVTSKIDDLLQQYALLLKRIESNEFESEQLNEWKSKILTFNIPASERLATLSSFIDSLGNRNNMIFGFLGNGFLLWDLRFTYRIENWMEAFDGELTQWFETIAKFDAINSMANYSFNHQDYVYPTITENPKLQFKAENLGHPLLNHKKMVTNSISLDQQDFFIITGANMAGKSTFLRTVAMNIVMANCGLPVCAESFEYRPVKLISSMRTSDSLVNDESYFFSELKRLKFIVDRIQTETYFIILDEILKGTNSVDKAEGSKKFVERLVNSQSTGLIATHDLSLCTLADKYESIENHYFDAEIVNDELYFDYRFKDGICQNMNASFLLKKMGIV